MRVHTLCVFNAGRAAQYARVLLVAAATAACTILACTQDPQGEGMPVQTATFVTVAEPTATTPPLPVPTVHQPAAPDAVTAMPAGFRAAADLPPTATAAPSPSPTSTALTAPAETPSPTATVPPTPVPATAPPSPTPAATPAPPEEPTPTAAPSPTAVPSPSPAPTPTPAPTATTPPGALVIECVFFNDGSGAPQSGEYVRIRNIGGSPAQLLGWSVTDLSEGSPTFVFPGYFVDPGAEARVYTNQVHPQYGGFSFGRGSGIWANGDPDIAGLLDPAGAVVSQATYPPGCPPEAS